MTWNVGKHNAEFNKQSSEEQQQWPKKQAWFDEWPQIIRWEGYYLSTFGKYVKLLWHKIMCRKANCVSFIKLATHIIPVSVRSWWVRPIKCVLLVGTHDQGMQEMPMVIMLIWANGNEMTNTHNNSNVHHASKQLTWQNSNLMLNPRQNLR
jgi:hypothetical protein